jgi:hypothetical protein
MPRIKKIVEAGEDTATQSPKKSARTRKAKYITLYSSFLMKETKHELVGDPVITEKGKQQWARCTKSHHSQLVNLDALENESDKSKSVIHYSKDDTRIYSPQDIYEIGDVIFHKIWDDVGIVQGKDTTSSGGNAIIVQFEKNARKTLIENLIM